jgi:DNA topoisomerase-1
MGSKLVIVESPAKAKTINKILGKDFLVKSSMGHVRDLPVKNIGVDIKDSFRPKYVIVKGRQKVIDELKKAAVKADHIYLAPDPDREGEAIAWHLKAILDDDKGSKTFLRVQYNEITPAAVKKAFEHPGEIDLKRVNAQQARRILDRIVGYMVSPVLWRRIRRGLSAGRVQSVALRLVCEREKEIKNFVPEEYWLLGAKVRKLVEPLDPFKIKLIRVDGEKADVRSGEQAEKVRKDLEGRTLRVAEIAVKEISKRPGPPFITSSLQQAASSSYGFEPKRTMSIAQELYEGIDLGEGPVGLITYMRTDSFFIAQDALQSCRSFIGENFGAEFLPEKPNYFKSRESSQEAHEAIRPTDVRRTPDSVAHRLDPAELKIYKLIWQRFVSSQMAAARIEQKTAKVEALPPPGVASTYLFHGTASQVIFPGYMKVTGADIEKPENGNGEEIDTLPPLSEGENLECLEWLMDRKETQPPPRYSEASLIKALEEDGVGRPSTYAQIISTLHQRKYVVREKRSLFPTELGVQVNELLVTNLGELFNVEFTASMEASLDKIEEGTVDWTGMLTEFYGQFEGWMQHVKEPPADQVVVGHVLAAMQKITEWAPEVKRGKRTYSDNGFVDSVRKQMEEGKKEISTRQLTALLRIACRYRSKVPEMEQVLAEAGYAEVLDAPEAQPPRESTMKKLELLRSLDIEESGKKFVESLHSQASSGRRLSDRQVHALNRILVSHASQVENFEEIKHELEMGHTEKQAEDPECGELIQALNGVSEWRAPVTRGRRVFDDKQFFASLSLHYSRKKYLSFKQKAALKKMYEKYRGQIAPSGEGAAAKPAEPAAQ